jgi:nucleoid-associated protein YgaU
VDDDGDLVLEQTGIADPGWTDPLLTAGAIDAWEQQAANLRRLMYGTPLSEPIQGDTSLPLRAEDWNNHRYAQNFPYVPDGPDTAVLNPLTKTPIQLPKKPSPRPTGTTLAPPGTYCYQVNSDTPPVCVRTYRVRKGDYLALIAQTEYGDPTKWQQIYQANKDIIGPNPHDIRALKVGMILKIP